MIILVPKKVYRDPYFKEMDTPNRVEKRSCPLPPLSFLSNQVERTAFSFFFFLSLPASRRSRSKTKARKRRRRRLFKQKSPLRTEGVCIVADSIRASPLFPGNITEHTTHPSHGYEVGGPTRPILGRKGVSLLLLFHGPLVSWRNETKRNTVYVTENNPG